jgi:hypothetical protein
MEKTIARLAEESCFAFEENDKQAVITFEHLFIILLNHK